MSIGLANTTVSLLVACLSGVIAIATLVRQATLEKQRQQREHAFSREQKEADRRLAAEQLVRRYRDPLVFAADQLLSRIENVRDNGFLEKYGRVRRDYVVASTTYAVAEILGWIELFRQNQQFLDLGEEQATRRTNECLGALGRAFSTDTITDAAGLPATFMIWRQEQRAIGELMIAGVGDQARCIGYATFNAKLADRAFARWFESLLRDVTAAIDEPERAVPRLIELADAATVLIDHLDPSRIRALKRSGRDGGTPSPDGTTPSDRS
jgi:hypothetical protein